MQYRFIAKKIGEGRTAKWRVYDAQNGSWPYQTPELGVVLQDVTEAEAHAEAERLHAAFGGRNDTGRKTGSGAGRTKRGTDLDEPDED